MRLISKPTSSWAKKFLDKWRKMPAENRRNVGMAFNTQKHVPLTNKACIYMARTAIGSLVPKPEESSTYSWERIAPTLVLAAKFSGPKVMALGDWQDKGLGGKEDGASQHRQ